MERSGLNLYFGEITQEPLLSQEEEWRLFEQVTNAKQEQADSFIQAQGKRAYSCLIERNLRLVVGIARKYASPHMELEDLIQEGNLGLMHAVEKFDYKMGYRFTTYATWWILQGITRAIAEKGRTIRLPEAFGNKIRRFVRAKRDLYQELQCEPTLQEIALRLNLTIENVEEFVSYTEDVISLDAGLLSTDEERSLADLVIDEVQVSPEEQVEYVFLQEAIQNMLSSSLSPREQQVLQTRFGLEDGYEQTRSEVGKELRMSQERIRQLEKQAILKLRHSDIAANLLEYLV